MPFVTDGALLNFRFYYIQNEVLKSFPFGSLRLSVFCCCTSEVSECLLLCVRLSVCCRTTYLLELESYVLYLWRFDTYVRVLSVFVCSSTNVTPWSWERQAIKDGFVSNVFWLVKNRNTHTCRTLTHHKNPAMSPITYYYKDKIFVSFPLCTLCVNSLIIYILFFSLLQKILFIFT